MPNYRLTLCYDGTRWKGWQKQGNTDNTIQGKLETLLSRLLDQPVEVAGSGRTDGGTHARGQVASFRAAPGNPGGAAPVPAGGHRGHLPGGGPAPVSRPAVLRGKDLCVPHLAERGPQRF